MKYSLTDIACISSFQFTKKKERARDWDTALQPTLKIANRKNIVKIFLMPQGKIKSLLAISISLLASKYIHFLFRQSQEVQNLEKKRFLPEK